MADVIRWDSEAVETCINQYSEAKTHLQECYSTYMSAIATLSTSWQGIAAAAFVEATQNISGHINHGFDKIEDAVTELRAVNETFASGESSQKSTMASADAGSASPFSE